MKRQIIKKTTALVLIYVLLTNVSGVFTQVKEDEKPPKLPDVSKGRGSGSKSSQNDKMSVELRILYGQFKSSKSKSSNAETAIDNSFSDEQMLEVFGIEKDGNTNPPMSIAVIADADTTVAALREKGMKVFMREGDTIYGEIAVLDLGNLAEMKNVRKISAVKSVKTPDLPKEEKSPLSSKSAASTSNNRNQSQLLANEFNKANLTGKGVIVGVIDTGIDWRHPDFLRPDGTSRILAIWDFWDNSFKTSGGKIGSSPPTLDTEADALPGTIYTNAQINAALRGEGAVNTIDENGHGTAVAGTAAGNGGKLGAKFAGVASDADLIIFKTFKCDKFTEKYIYGAKWMTEMAKQLKRPIVINQSFGGHWSAHDGTEAEEAFLNRLTGKGIPGVVFTVSAGNEGLFSFHGEGKFGARRAGQEDIESSPVRMQVLKETMILGVFDSRDEWGAVVKPTAKNAMVDKNGKPLWFYVFKKDDELKFLLGDGLEKPDWFDAYMQEVLKYSWLGDKTDMLALGLKPGGYLVWGFGATEKVVNGDFSFYAPQYRNVDFGYGTSKTQMVGSPGNAANVITVGAYNFRADWLNSEGGSTIFNLQPGTISGYTSPGGMLPGSKTYKPDIAAPATYTISPLSQNSKPNSRACGGNNLGDELGARFVTPDGLHIAWDGTSAASPFTAGVIALMLQKNPRLDAERVRQILIKTATKGGIIGAVPNPSWGNGMLNPALAIRNTPVGK